MKCAFALAVGLLAAANVANATPMEKVVKLLEDMKTKITKTGKSEQASYDKYSCWCEDTLDEKAEDITKAKDKLEELQNNINKNKGGQGSGGATIAQLKKDIAENVASTTEATNVRKKENTEYDEERTSAEQCIGALEAAIKVLTGAGSGKKGFLETLQEAQLLSVVASMRPVVNAPVIKHSFSKENIQVVEHFLESPTDFVAHKASMSATQIAQNPFGDYAPKSNQIQGILKSMYDSFTSDLEKDNVDEGEKQKAFEELMATKKKELATLTSSLQDESKSDAQRTKELADDKAMRDDTREQLDSDEAFFAQTKESCSTKAKHWAQRSRSRSVELDGLSEAIKILSSDDAKKTFKGATKFLQVSSMVHRRGSANRDAAYRRLISLNSRYHSLQLAHIAMAVKTTGHFDDVIVMIDKMVAVLREEGQSDIEHRDRCENKQNANTNSKDDADHEISKAKDAIERLEQAMKDKKEEIKEIEKSQGAAKKTMADIKKQRTKDNEAYKLALKDDQDAIVLLDKAKDALGKFYRDTSALQVEPAAVNMVAEKPAPNTNWQGGDYKGSTGEARGVIGILEMLKEDHLKQIKTEGQDEIDAQVAYEKEFTALTRNFRALEKTKDACESELASLGSDKQDQVEVKTDAENDLADEKKLAKAIAADCDWIKSHFDKRRASRAAEVDGLVEAKEFLAQAGSPSDLEMP